MTMLTHETIARLETVIQTREKLLEKFESIREGLPEGNWKIPMYESLIDAYTESMTAITEVMDVLGWDWETSPDGDVQLIIKDNDTFVYDDTDSVSTEEKDG